MSIELGEVRSLIHEPHGESKDARLVDFYTHNCDREPSDETYEYIRSQYARNAPNLTNDDIKALLHFDFFELDAPGSNMQAVAYGFWGPKLSRLLLGQDVGKGEPSFSAMVSLSDESIFNMECAILNRLNAIVIGLNSEQYIYISEDGGAYRISFQSQRRRLDLNPYRGHVCIGLPNWAKIYLGRVAKSLPSQDYSWRICSLGEHDSPTSTARSFEDDKKFRARNTAHFHFAEDFESPLVHDQSILETCAKLGIDEIARGFEPDTGISSLDAALKLFARSRPRPLTPIDVIGLQTHVQRYRYAFRLIISERTNQQEES